MRQLYFGLVLAATMSCSYSPSNHEIFEEVGSDVSIDNAKTYPDSKNLNLRVIDADDSLEQPTKMDSLTSNGKTVDPLTFKSQDYGHLNTAIKRPKDKKSRYFGMHFVVKALDPTHDCSKH